MKIIITKALLICTLLGTMANAGGKTVAPVDAEVIPIGENISSWYLGTGGVWTKFSACSDNCDYEDVTYGAMLRAGYEFNEYFGIEVRVMRTFLEEGPFGGVPLQHVGVYAKPQYPMSERINMYGFLGYGYTENLGNGARLNYFDNDHGFSAGLGLEYDLSDKEGDFIKEGNYNRDFDGDGDQNQGWSLFVDYQRLLIKENIPDMDVVSLGVRYDF